MKGVIFLKIDFDKISEKATNVFHLAVGKANSAVETAKMSYNLSTIENDLNDAYTELGKTVYANRGCLQELDLAECFNSITFLLDKIEQEQEKLCAKQSCTFCSVCGAKISKKDAYCKNCGTKTENL